MVDSVAFKNSQGHRRLGKSHAVVAARATKVSFRIHLVGAYHLSTTALRFTARPVIHNQQPAKNAIVVNHPHRINLSVVNGCHPSLTQ